MELPVGCPLHGGVIGVAEQTGFGQIGQDQIGLAAKLAHTGQERFHPNVKTPMVGQNRVHHLECVGPERKRLVDQLLLGFAGQITGIDAVKFHAQLAVMVQRGLSVVGQRLHGGFAQTAGVGGKQSGGQQNGLMAHCRQHRRGNAQAATSHTGQIMDA